jgi:hypothetical protein
MESCNFFHDLILLKCEFHTYSGINAQIQIPVAIYFDQGFQIYTYGNG